MRRTFTAEGRLHRHEVFCKQFLKRVSWLFQKGQNYRRRRDKIGMLHRMETSRRIHTPSDGVAGGRGVMTNLTPHSF